MREITPEELKQKLDKEYKELGEINMGNVTKKTIKVSDIKYINDIMSNVEPVEDNDLIVVAENWDDNYYVIDGYHRLKRKLLDGVESIEVLLIDNFSIKRNHDNLFGFLEGLAGKSIKFVNSNLILVDNKLYQIEENEGCGGCSNGWSSIVVLDEFINKEINIEDVKQGYKNDGYENDEYELFINGIKIADVDTGWGNGFYGGDFKINLIN